jgi:hypothetical protein
MAEAFRIDSRAEQAERRRKQLVTVVAHLVVTRGVAAVSATLRSPAHLSDEERT